MEVERLAYLDLDKSLEEKEKGNSLFKKGIYMLTAYPLPTDGHSVNLRYDSWLYSERGQTSWPIQRIV